MASRWSVVVASRVTTGEVGGNTGNVGTGRDEPDLDRRDGMMGGTVADGLWFANVDGGGDGEGDDGDKFVVAAEGAKAA